MRFGLGAIGVACCLALTACDLVKGAVDGATTAWRKESPQITAAKESVASELKDPQSAQFRNLKTYPEGVVCGDVNAKMRWAVTSDMVRSYIGQLQLTANLSCPPI